RCWVTRSAPTAGGSRDNSCASSASKHNASTRATPVACPFSAPNRHVVVTPAVPPNLHRHVRVVDGLFTDIIARAVVDLPIRPLDDAEHDDDATARLQATAREPLALERHLLAHTRPQQLALRA